MVEEIIKWPALRDDKKLYGTLLEEMFHEYVVSDTFCLLSPEDRRERVGAYEEINQLIESAIEASGIAEKGQSEKTEEKDAA